MTKTSDDLAARRAARQGAAATPPPAPASEAPPPPAPGPRPRRHRIRRAWRRVVDVLTAGRIAALERHLAALGAATVQDVAGLRTDLARVASRGDAVGYRAEALVEVLTQPDSARRRAVDTAWQRRVDAHNRKVAAMQAAPGAPAADGGDDADV